MCPNNLFSFTSKHPTTLRRRSNGRQQVHFDKETIMTTTMNSNGSTQRKQLSFQLDRLDAILDGLAEALNESVASAVKDVVGEVVRESVEATIREVLGNPEL